MATPIWRTIRHASLNQLSTVASAAKKPESQTSQQPMTTWDILTWKSPMFLYRCTVTTIDLPKACCHPWTSARSTWLNAGLLEREEERRNGKKRKETCCVLFFNGNPNHEYGQGCDARRVLSTALHPVPWCRRRTFFESVKRSKLMSLACRKGLDVVATDLLLLPGPSSCMVPQG